MRRLLAIMAGVLEMDGEQLVEEFARFCHVAFAEGVSRDVKAQNVERELKRVVSDYSVDRGGEERMLLSGNSRCKV
jgi:hypothetical protein